MICVLVYSFSLPWSPKTKGKGKSNWSPQGNFKERDAPPGYLCAKSVGVLSTGKKENTIEVFITGMTGCTNRNVCLYLWEGLKLFLFCLSH